MVPIEQGETGRVDRSAPLQRYRLPDNSLTPRPARPRVDKDGDLVAYQLYRVDQDPLFLFGHFSTNTAFAKLEVWRFVTFQFLHANFWHIAFNMLALFFFGPAVEAYCGSRRRFLAFYFTCGIAGAALYLVLNLFGQFGVQLPGVLLNRADTPLVGASAGVFGVLMATARIAGNATMLVMFVIPMKVKTGAWLLFGLALFNLLAGGTNQGGDAAHVGGAIAGWLLILRLHLLNDFFDIFGGGAGKSAGKKKTSARRSRTAPGGGGGSSRTDAPLTPREEAKLDAILEKVSNRGMDALTKKERDFLSSARDRKRRG
jgi:membrane associated rhomboid family serine protease